MSDDATPTLPAIADAPGLPDADRAPRKRIWSWALWDWATQPFNTVILTFVFTALYLTSDNFIDPALAQLPEDSPERIQALDALSANLGWGITVAGVFIALMAPVLGQRADARGRRKTWLGVTTVLLVASMAGLFWVEAAPQYFWLGVALIAFASIVGEIAGVNYNAMIVQVSTPSTMGRISGLGWGLGYMGGILALVLVIVADTLEVLPAENGLGYRLIAVGCAVWTLAFAWPLFVWVPEAKPADRPRVNLLQGYVVLFHSLKELWHGARSTLWFLLASAVYRDGLAGVFTFGAIIAAKSFGFAAQEVIIFGVAANLIAGVSTFVAGRMDDKWGPRKVIIASLSIVVLSGVAVVAFHDMGAEVFWVGGLILSAMVGPAQASSRSLLARLSPQGRETEIFGLYATTGRAASFLASAGWAGAITLFGATIWGTAGVLLVVLVGLVLLFMVHTPADKPVSA